jgi:hypothetical protein
MSFGKSVIFTYFSHFVYAALTSAHAGAAHAGGI